MKKLLLLLLCVPLIYSCGDKKENESRKETDIPQNICNIKADYILTVEELESEYEENNESTDKKYKGKILEISGDVCARGKINNDESGNPVENSSYIQLCNKSRFDFLIEYSKLKKDIIAIPKRKTRYGKYTFVTIKGIYIEDLMFENCCLISK